jgi:acyl-CoA synthetase (AMP-forming)/AMP-acid ligase II
MHYEACMALTPADRSIVAVPLSHVTGLVAQLHAMARCAGTLVLMDTFKAAAFLELAARERITHTVMVPAMYALCLLQGELAAHDLSAWRLGAYGGAPMPPATIEALAHALPALQLMNAYGATETTSPTTLMPPRETARHADSVGRPVPCADVRVVDPAGRDVTCGETGEIWIRGPMVVAGYWQNEAATAASFTDGWWHFGRPRPPRRGRLPVRAGPPEGRRQPRRLQGVLERGRGGAGAACGGARVGDRGPPVPVLGERVHAFVALREPVDAGTLRAHCAARLSDYKVPETWTLVDAPLPRNANGKLLKRELRERASSGACD